MECLTCRQRRLRARSRDFAESLPAEIHAGQSLSYDTLRSRFDKAREDAGIPFAEFQFRDLRAKAGTDKTDAEGVGAAQGQLGHNSVTTTEIYIRKGVVRR